MVPLLTFSAAGPGVELNNNATLTKLLLYYDHDLRTQCYSLVVHHILGCCTELLVALDDLHDKNTVFGSLLIQH